MQLSHNQVFDVVLRSRAHELLGEVDDEHRIDAHLFRQLQAPLKRHHGQRRAFREEDRDGVRIKSHHHRAQFLRARIAHRIINELLMAAVYAVKDADGHRSRAKVTGDAVDSVPNIHGHHANARRGVE